MNNVIKTLVSAMLESGIPADTILATIVPMLGGIKAAQLAIENQDTPEWTPEQIFQHAG